MSYDAAQPNHVRPHNFKYEQVFYFDRESAIMIGKYKDSQDQSVGMRWMEAEGEMGYPVSHGNPMWMVVPDQLALYMLEGIEHGDAAHIVDKPGFENALRYMKAKLSAA